MSNLSMSKGTRNMVGLNFADILDDVTYLPDPSGSQRSKDNHADLLRLPGGKDRSSELKVASYAQEGPESNKPGRKL